MFPKIVGFPPKSSTLIGCSIIKHPFCGTPIVGNSHVQKCLEQILFSIVESNYQLQTSWRDGSYMWFDINCTTGKTNIEPANGLEEEMVNVDWFSWVEKSHIKPQKLKIHRHFKMVWPSETVRKANLVVISNTLLGNNISPPKALEDDFLFPRWDTLVS